MTPQESRAQFAKFIEKNNLSFARALGTILNADIPVDPRGLSSWVNAFIDKNGAAAEEILVEAVSKMQPINDSATTDGKSGGGNGWATVVSTGLQVIGSIFGADIGGGSANNEAILAVARENAESQRKLINTVLIVMGLIVVAVIGFLVWKNR